MDSLVLASASNQLRKSRLYFYISAFCHLRLGLLLVLLAVRPVWGQSISSEPTQREIQGGHSGAVSSVAFSPNGHWLATASQDQTIQIWDVAQRRMVRTLSGHTAGVNSVAFSPDSSVLASAGQDGSIRLWLTDKDWKQVVLAGTNIPIFSAVFSQDGRHIITGDLSGHLNIRDVSTGSLVQNIKDHGVIDSVAISRNGQFLASATEAIGEGGENAVHLWVLETGKELWKAAISAGPVTGLSFSPSDELLATSQGDGMVKVWNIPDGSELSTHSNPIEAAVFAPDGSLVTFGDKIDLISSNSSCLGKPYILRILPVPAFQESRSFCGPQGRLIALSPDGTLVAVAGDGLSGAVSVWEAATGAEIIDGTPRDQVNGVSTSPAGDLLASALNHTVILWDISKGTVRPVKAGTSELLTNTRFSPKGNSIAAWGFSHSFVVIGWPDGRSTTFSAHTGKVNSVDFSPDDSTIVSGGDDHTIRLWNAATGSLVKTITSSVGYLGTVRYSHDGKSIVSYGSDLDPNALFDPSVDYHQTVEIWDAQSGQLIRKFAGPVLQIGAQQAILSNDDKVLLTVQLSEVFLQDLHTGRVIRHFKTRQNIITAAMLSPTGELLISGGTDHSVRLWNADTQDQAGNFVGHTAPVTSLTGLGNRQIVVSGAEDGTIRLWDITRGHNIATLATFHDGRAWTLGTPGGIVRGPIVPPQRGQDLRKMPASADDHAPGVVVAALAHSIASIPKWSALIEDSAVPQLLLKLPAGLSVDSTSPNSMRLEIVASTPGRATVAGNIAEIHLMQDGLPLRIWSEDLHRTMRGPLVLSEDVYLHKGNNKFTAYAVSRSGRHSSIAELILQNSAIRPSLFVRTGHSGPVYAIQFGASGTLFASAGQDQSIILWDSSTGEELRRLNTQCGSIAALDFSHSGDLLVAGCHDGTVELWHTYSGQLLRRLKAHGDAVWAVSLSPKGEVLATGSSDNTVALWDVASGRELHTLLGHEQAVTRVIFSPDGRLLASAGVDKSVCIWDAATGRLITRLTDHTESIVALAFSPDGSLLASGAQFGTVKVWDVNSRSLVRTFQRSLSTSDPADVRPFALDDLLFSTDGKQLIVAEGLVFAPDVGAWISINDIKGAIRFLDASSGQEKSRISSDKIGVGFKGLSVDKRGQVLAWGDTTGAVHILNVLKSSERTIAGVGSGASSVAVSPTSQFLALGGANIFTWDLLNGRLGPSLTTDSAVSSVAFGRGDDQLASEDNQGRVRLWDSISQASSINLGSPHTNSTIPFNKSEVAFSADARLLCSTHDQGTVQIWDMNTHSLASSLGSEKGSGGVGGCQFSHTDNRLIAVSGGRLITTWDPVTRLQLKSIDTDQNNVDAAVFSPDDSLIATSGLDGIAIWNATTGEKKIDIPDTGAAVIFSPNGKWLVAAGGDSIRIWDTETGRLVKTLVADLPMISAVAFVRLPSQDGGNGSERLFLATAGWNGTGRLWDIERGSLLATLLNFNASSDWLVVSPEGFFDGTAFSWSRMAWRFSADTHDVSSMEVWFRDYYHPNLLHDILNGIPLNPVSSIANLNRGQPKIDLEGARLVDAQNASVVVTVASTRSEVQRDAQGRPLESGVYDVRLFRDGQLVGQWPEVPAGADERLGPVTSQQEMQAWRRLHQVKLDAAGNATITFNNIRLPQRAEVKEVTFTAYAFNSDRVKSASTPGSSYMLRPAADRTPVTRTAYLITMGVNAHQSHWNLGLAVSSAERARALLGDKLRQTYGRVVEIPLYSDLAADSPAVAVIKARGENLQAVLDLLAGRTVTTALRDAVDPEHKVQTATPDDAVIVYVASHGYADSQGNFHLIPYDTGPWWDVTEDALARCGLRPSGSSLCQHAAFFLAHSVSSSELGDWWRGVDAGEMVMVLDTCHSGAAPGEAFRPAPLGDPGFGQLAYDKGMIILAASQPAQTERGQWVNGGEGRTLLINALVTTAGDNPQDSLKQWLHGVERELPALGKQLYPQLNRAELPTPELLDFTNTLGHTVSALLGSTKN